MVKIENKWNWSSKSRFGQQNLMTKTAYVILNKNSG
jgi:hypothetical protein